VVIDMDGRKILIVEDDRLIALDYELSLERLGFVITSIVDAGEDAIEHAKNENPDLVLMDINLKSKMDGIEAAAVIYSQLKIPVIFVTAFSDTKLINRAKKAGSFGFLLKPFNRAEIYIMIEMALDKANVERELEISKAQLEIENASKDKFFSIISHDLKSPIGVIMSTSEFLDNEYDDFSDKERKELIHVLKNSSRRIYDLLEGLLNWARAKMGNMEYNPRSINLSRIVTEVVELIQFTSKNKEIELLNNISNNLMVFADENMITLVIRNLLSNAVKFTSNGGKVEINSKLEDNKIVVSITDNGVGIRYEDQQKLFRIDMHHTTIGTNEEVGTGIGLIFCKELVGKNKGKIWVESEIGKGSVFSFTLPTKDLEGE